jgi:Ca-activated chloride channel homolog
MRARDLAAASDGIGLTGDSACPTLRSRSVRLCGTGAFACQQSAPSVSFGDFKRAVSPRVVASLCLLFTAFYARAQRVAVEPRVNPSAPEAVQRRPNLRVDSNLVVVPVTVCDKFNRPVTGLEKENFRILDSGVEQEITQFSMDDEAVAVGLIFDVSGSMGQKLSLSRLAASAFFHIANPEDEFFLVAFDSNPRLLVPLTMNPGDVEDRIAFSKSKGSTALVDAVVLGLHELKKSKKTRKALLVISDGGDNHSRYNDLELRNMIRESDALIYCIGVYGGASTSEEYRGPGTMRYIAEPSGGRELAASARELPDIAAKIGIELRNRYVLSYAPKNPQRDGKYHALQVRVVPPRGLTNLTPFWRRGYFAPVE